MCSSILNFHVDLLLESDLAVVLEEVSEISHKWYNVGLILGVTPRLLKEIRANNCVSCDCLREVLCRWLLQTVGCLHKIAVKLLVTYAKNYRSHLVPAGRDCTFILAIP